MVYSCVAPAAQTAVNMTTKQTDTRASSWDRYWRGTGSADAFSAGGVSHPAVSAFWEHFFRDMSGRFVAPRVLDIATGNGAIVEAALNGLAADLPAVSAVDVARAAVDNVTRRFPAVTGIVADAASLPLGDGDFDVVTSQFGVEYAGGDAIYEAARLVRAGGVLAVLMHVEDGVVHEECAASLAAISRLQEAGFVSLAREMFQHGFAAVRGADRRPYDAAGAKLAVAVREVEAIIGEFGTGVAGETVAKLYDDVGRIHQGLPKFDPDEVLGWLDRMEEELVSYAGRMSSMIDTVLDESGFRAVRNGLGERGFSIERGERLEASGMRRPLAWALVATRREDADGK